MKDDFTRDTFDPSKHFSRVLTQQGRVTLDADYNEQTSILLHLIRTLTRDVLGPCAVPSTGGGFNLVPTGKTGLGITAGRFYVDGLLVENEEDCDYTAQSDYPLLATDALAAELQKPTGLAFWVYLDVWERNITWIEDASIREVALNGPDTCARSKVVWQVKALSATDLQPTSAQIAALQQEMAVLQKQLAQTTDPATQSALKNQISVIQQQIARYETGAPVPLTCSGPLSRLTSLGNASLTAQLDPGKQIVDPCLMAPAAQYRGAENQLYRVEIHTPGTAGKATFKWSRDNGSLATPWLGTTGNDIQVGDARGFTVGCWVELTDDTFDLQGLPGVLVQLTKVDGGVLTLDPGPSLPDISKQINPKARRWDQQSSDAIQLFGGTVPITESLPAAPVWIDLEDGIQVSFASGGVYRTGDYWLIPARVATGQIEWPATLNADGTSINAALPPAGIEHHYAPLGILEWVNGILKFQPCRCEFDPINHCYGKGSIAVGAHLLTANTLANRSFARPRNSRKAPTA